jgi:hypothetical protein
LLSLWLITLIAAPAQPVLSQDGVQVTENDAWVDFPRAVDFHLVATGTAPIERVDIEYGVDALTCGDVTTVVTPHFAPDTAVDITWRWQIVPDQVIPPGGRIWWRWRLTTAQEEVTTTPTQTVVFIDDWFFWQSIQDRNLTVHWFRGPRSLAQEMLSAGHDSLEQLAADTGLRLEDPIAIYLYEEPSDLRLSVPGAPEWIGGIAFPEYNTVLAVANETHADYGRLTVRHELAHLVIERLTFNCLTELPVWLNEGLAMVAEVSGDENQSLDATTTLKEAIADNHLLTIRQIEGTFSVYTGRAALSYVESHSLVKFLIDNYGQERMLTLLMAFREGVTPDDALTSTYGFDTLGLENAWREDIGASPVAPIQEKVNTPVFVPTLALSTVPSANPTSTIPPILISSSETPIRTPKPATKVALVASALPTHIPTATIARIDRDRDSPSFNWPVWVATISVLLISAFVIWRSQRS